MHLREAQQAHASADTHRRLVGPYGMSSSPADELTKLARLRDQGVLSEGEFSTLKARILVSSS
jgi:putative oligomerization/nucleic acid binding protein